MARELSLFTKKEIRIDSQGNAIKEAAQRKKLSGGISCVGKGRGKNGMKALQKKLLQQQETTGKKTGQGIWYLGKEVSQSHHCNSSA